MNADRSPDGPPSRAQTSVASAHRLLSQLREVARSLPTGLDEVALAQTLLGQLAPVIRFNRGLVYDLGESGQLDVVAAEGVDGVDSDLERSHPQWRQADDVQLTSTATTTTAVFPLRLDDRLVGAVQLELSTEVDDHPWSAYEIAAARSLIDDAAIYLDSGRLFSEVRAIATTEERRRLARDIHDGIAQEVASLGYVVDDLAARAEGDLHDRIIGLRDELTRIVTELRHSIFDLRSDIQPGTGLGAALSSYVRTVGATSGLTIHLVLDETTKRLSAATEVELLRITQEAVTNVRRHAQARNLWVTCRVDPPHAFLRIADDGRGMGSPRIDSYGLDIMRERAERLGVALTVREREGGGTVVELALGRTHSVHTTQLPNAAVDLKGAPSWLSRS